MKTNSKGFTLIELLAVIVILAVIALIATPLIMGVIDDARKGSAKNGAYGYVKAMENIFAILIAVMVMISIRWVGILLINSLIILPAASSRNISMNMRSYHLFSIIFALFSGISGLIISYYTNIPTGPMIVIISGIIYFITFGIKKVGVLDK